MELIYETGIRVTTEDGTETANVKLVLPKMNLNDVLKLEIAQLKSILGCLEAQLAEIEKVG